MSALMQSPGYLLSFIFVFTLIVFVHEMGHFLAARALGARVEVFSIGFGKRLFERKDRYGTLWTLSLFPVGGYVKFLGDSGAASMPDQKSIEAARETVEEAENTGARGGVFHLLPIWRRAIIVAAGPLMNFVFAIVVFSSLLMAFGAAVTPPVVGGVEADSPAAVAGFLPGDRVLKADGRAIKSFTDIATVVSIAANQPVRFLVDRDGDEVRLEAIPTLLERDDPLGHKMRIGYLGIRSLPGAREHVKYGPLRAVTAGAARTWYGITDQLKFMGRLLRGRGSVDLLGGPLRIFAYTGAVGTAQADTPSQPQIPLSMRLVNLIGLAGLLSVAIGLVNLLPVPVLDGGHLLYYSLEAIMGRPLSEKAQLTGFKIGFALILGLMVFATVNDLRYFGLFDTIGRLFS